MGFHAKILGGVAAAALFAAVPAVAHTATAPTKMAAAATTAKMAGPATKAAASDAAKTVKAAAKTDMTAAKTEKTADKTEKTAAKTEKAAAKEHTATKEASRAHHHRWHRAMRSSMEERMAANKTTAELNEQQLTHPGTTAGVATTGDSMSHMNSHSKPAASSDKKPH